jgi:hypothetical protein
MIEKVIMSMLLLILLYLVANHADSVDNTINAMTKVSTNQISALQGR